MKGRNRRDFITTVVGGAIAAVKHDGIKYRDLLHRILTLGMQRAAGTVARADKA